MNYFSDSYMSRYLTEIDNKIYDIALLNAEYMTYTFILIPNIRSIKLILYLYEMLYVYIFTAYASVTYMNTFKQPKFHHKFYDINCVLIYTTCQIFNEKLFGAYRNPL